MRWREKRRSSSSFSVLSLPSPPFLLSPFCFLSSFTPHLLPLNLLVSIPNVSVCFTDSELESKSEKMAASALRFQLKEPVGLLNRSRIPGSGCS